MRWKNIICGSNNFNLLSILGREKNMNKKELSLENFYNSFMKRIEERKQEVEDTYTKSSTAYTLLIFDILQEILREDYHYNSYRKSDISKEYYRIDLIGWTTRFYEKIKDLDDKLDKTGLNKHIWNFDIAIEHENDHNDWLDEVVKLAYINCPIRIVIGYVDRNKFNKLKNADSPYLNVAIKTLNELEKQNGDKRNLIKNSDSFGIILGSGIKGQTSFNFDKINYQLYKIECDGAGEHEVKHYNREKVKWQKCQTKKM